MPRPDEEFRTDWPQRLAEAFPVVRAFAGVRGFRALAAAFAETQPHADPPLERFGRTFPDHMEASNTARAMPFLPELGRLEWALYESALAPDAEALSPGALAEVPPEFLTGISFTLHPAARVLLLNYPVLGLWQAKGRIRPPALTKQAEAVLVTRLHGLVRPHGLAPGAGLTLRGLREGLRLGSAYERAFVRAPNFDLHGLLTLCLTQGAFSGLAVLPGRTPASRNLSTAAAHGKS